MPTSNRNNSGFTLAEVMVAILIMMVGMLGLLESINVATEYNLKNHLRDEAVYVGEKYMNELRGKAFATSTVTYPLISTATKIRGVNKKLMVETSSTQLADDAIGTTNQLQVLVKWTYKGVEYQNRVTAPRSIIK
ncbi:MAG: prepilin-type N-terminal cleavage/methylation domain-containing protein [Geobacteraceae bacterium]